MAAFMRLPPGADSGQAMVATRPRAGLWLTSRTALPSGDEANDGDWYTRVLVFPGSGGSHSGLVRPPAKRVGAVEASRGFESLPLRRCTHPPSPLTSW